MTMDIFLNRFMTVVMVILASLFVVCAGGFTVLLIHTIVQSWGQ